MQCALEAMVDSLRAEVHSVKHQLRSSQETLNAEKMELQRELESTQQKLMMLQAQSEAHKVATHLDAHTLPKFCSSWTIPPTPSQKVPHFIQMPNSETGSFHSLSRIPQGQGQGIIYNHSDNLLYHTELYLSVLWWSSIYFTNMKPTQAATFRRLWHSVHAAETFLLLKQSSI